MLLKTNYPNRVERFKEVFYQNIHKNNYKQTNNKVNIF